MLFLIYVSTVKMRKYFILCELIGVFWGRKSVVGILFRSHAFWPKESRKKIHHLSSSYYHLSEVIYAGCSYLFSSQRAVQCKGLF